MKIGTELSTSQGTAGVSCRTDRSALPFDAVMAGVTGSLSVSENTYGDNIGESEDSTGPFTGFFKELQEKKMEELREKILEEMGLTEEALAKMAPEQRSRVERIIAREITQRLAAQSAMNNDQNAAMNRQILLEGLGPLSL